MATAPVSFSSAEVDPSSAQNASQPVSFSSSEVDQHPQQQGPVNPYANKTPSAPWYERARQYVANGPVGKTLQADAPGVAQTLHLQPTPDQSPIPTNSVYQNNDVLHDPLGMKTAPPVNNHNLRPLVTAKPTIKTPNPAEEEFNSEFKGPSWEPAARPAPANAYVEMEQDAHPAPFVPVAPNPVYELAQPTPPNMDAMQQQHDSRVAAFIKANPLVVNDPSFGQLDPNQTDLPNDLKQQASLEYSALAKAGLSARDVTDYLRQNSAFNWHPIQAVKEANQGLGNIAQSLGTDEYARLQSLYPDASEKEIDELVGQERAKAGQGKVNWNQTAQGGTQVIGGAMGLSQPLMAAGVAAAPYKMIAGYVAGVTAGYGSDYMADKLKMSPEMKELAHTVAFVAPNAFADFMSLRGSVGETTARIPDPVTGEIREVPVKTAAAGGRGFGVGVGKGEDGSYYAAGRVGPFSARAKWGGAPDGAPSPAGASRELTAGAGAPGEPPAPGSEPPAAPAAPSDATTIQMQAQMQTVQETAARAAGVQKQAEQVAGMTPPPPLAPKPGEPGSGKLPSPAGMDDGHLSQDTVDKAGQAIQMLPEANRPGAIREAVGNLASWMFDKKTVVGPDNKVVNVDSQRAAQTEAVKIINAEVDRQAEKAQNAAEQQQEAIEQRQESATQAQQERDEALSPQKATKPTADAGPVEIPNTPSVQKARNVLASAPMDTPAADLDVLIRRTATVTTPVRKALVQEEVTRRANQEQDQAQVAMTGQPTPEGQSREELQRWADGVKAGEHPFVHIPQESNFKPQGVEDLTRTPVKGAGAFSGTYYHAPEVSAADIRKAARDKKDPQGALDALVAGFKGEEKPVEFAGHEVEAAPVELKPEEVSQEAPVPVIGRPERTDQIGDQHKAEGGAEAPVEAAPVGQNAVPLSTMDRFKKAQQAKADKYLDTEGRMPDGKTSTRRERIDKRLADGWRVSVEQVKDDAGIRRIEREIKELGRGHDGWGAPANENHPDRIKLNGLKAKLKEGPTIPEYVISDGNGDDRIISKTEFDYAKSIEGNSAEVEKPETELKRNISGPESPITKPAQGVSLSHPKAFEQGRSQIGKKYGEPGYMDNPYKPETESHAAFEAGKASTSTPTETKSPEVETKPAEQEPKAVEDETTESHLEKAKSSQEAIENASKVRPLKELTVRPTKAVRQGYVKSFDPDNGWITDGYIGIDTKQAVPTAKKKIEKIMPPADGPKFGSTPWGILKDTLAAATVPAEPLGWIKTSLFTDKKGQESPPADVVFFGDKDGNTYTFNAHMVKYLDQVLAPDSYRIDPNPKMIALVQIKDGKPAGFAMALRLPKPYPLDHDTARQTIGSIGTSKEPVKLPDEAVSGLSQIAEEAVSEDPRATLDDVLRDPNDGKIIAEALVNDGIITESDDNVNPATALLTTSARAKVGDALLSTVIGPELAASTPSFIKEKLLGSMGSIGSISGADDRWNLKPALIEAVSQFGQHFRGEDDVPDAGPVVDAILKKLDSPIDRVRQAFTTYAVAQTNAEPEDDPVMDFNLAFGTELTEEQFADGIKAEAKDHRAAAGATDFEIVTRPDGGFKVVSPGYATSWWTGWNREGAEKWIAEARQNNASHQSVEKVSSAKVRLNAIPDDGLKPGNLLTRNFLPVDISEGASALNAAFSDAASRDKALSKARIEDVPVSQIITPQNVVSRKTIEGYLSGRPITDSSVILVKHGENYYIDDGNHATVAQILQGAKTIRARVIDADSSPRPLQKGDKVTYRTNKGKERTGEVAWTDGKKVRVKDGKSEVSKNIEDVKPVKAASPAAVEPSAPEVAADATLVDALQLAFEHGRGPKDYNGLKKIVEEFDGKKPDQLRMKEGQEAYEAMLNRVASQLVIKEEGHSSREVYDRLTRLYEGQPNLAIRTSTSIDNQAYSTPLPLAFIADKFAGISFRDGTTVYEPTAGNGALLIGADPRKATANELNPARAAMLEAEGFSVSRNDATTWTPTGRYDAVVANPPFAKLAGPVEIDGYKLVKLDHLIAAKALGVMKDAGKACIIIGAGDRNEPGNVTNIARPFFNWLYSHYNVVSDFELDGDLYARQGASWPVRVIAIDGRARTAKVSPVAEEIQRLKTWGEVYDKASEHLGANLEDQRRADDGTGDPVRVSTDRAAVSGTPGGQAGVAHQGESERGATGHGSDGRAGVPRPVQHTGGVPDPRVGSPDLTVRSDGDVAQSNRLAEGEPAAHPVRREPGKPDGHSANALADESNQFQGTYHPVSSKQDVNVMAPKALIDPMREAMERIKADVGDIDEWVAGELGYPDIETMHEVFMGLQVDAVAAAIHSLQQGKALIAADQTGVGKGRVAAAIIRWAEMHGHLPVFVTAGDQLFTDMHRDLHDIGSGDVICPLIFNAGSTITDAVTGKKIFGNNGAMRPVFERIQETGEIPAGRNAVFLTYSQINTENRQQLALLRLAPKAVFVLDESHNAGGDSNTGHFLQGVLAASKGAVFLSATWAKRPDNLPLYAAKTDIAIAIPDKDRIAGAIAAGGAPLQAVVTHQLAEAGELVRRERSFDGIEISNYVDEAHKKQHEVIADKVTEVLRSIVAADSAYHKLDFERLQAELKKAGKSGRSDKVVVNHMEFSSTVHNLVRQLLLALKADNAADLIVKAIEDGKKPIFALENTMGSFLDGYITSHGMSEGDILGDLTYSKIADRALMRTRYYNETDQMGNKTRIEVPLDKLSAKVREAYDAAQALIDNLNVDLPVSPIDHIRNKVEQAGYKIAEITGRKSCIDYSGSVPKLATVPGIEQNDRVNTASQFNNGGGDALIINQAGSTGISLHASEKFHDQRPRLMIVGQPAGDVNIVMQILGRINRTGQVALPSYIMQAVALPAEMRPAINLAKKMKSLNANVSSNTRSATSVHAVDLMNKYGDQVIAQYLVDNPEMMKQLGLDIHEPEAGTKFSADEIGNISMKATARSALLPVKQQREFMDAISEAYTNYINFLDETGQNDLEPKTCDYDARETHLEQIYQGTDSTSPFGQDAHYGEYSIKRQGKPFTAEEVQAKIADTFGPAAMQLSPRERDTLAARDLAAHMEGLFKPYSDELKTDHAIEKAETMRSMGRTLLSDYRVGTGLRVDFDGNTFNAVVTNIESAKKPSGNPYAPSTLQFTLAVNGALRQVRVPGSQLHVICVSNLGRNADIKELFRDYSSDRQKGVKIITGNLLGAFGQFNKGTRGRIISFTMSDGSTKMGILMPSKFDVKTDLTDTYAMRSPEGAMHFLQRDAKQTLISSNGEVGVIGNDQTGMEIRTKVSKAASGQFFLDPKLLELVVGGDFASSNGLMKAAVKEGRESDVLNNIMGKIALYPTPSMIDQARESDVQVAAGLTTKPSAAKHLASSGEAYSFLGSYQIAQGARRTMEDVGKLGKWLKGTAAPGTWGELTKAATTAGATGKQMAYELASVLYPPMLADADARDIMGRALGEPALELFKAGQFLEGVDKMFEGMPLKDQVEFVDRMQNGKEQPTNDLKQAQGMLESVLEAQRAREQEVVNLGRSSKQKPIELKNRAGYFPNRYSTPPGSEKALTEQEQMARIFPKRPFEGPKNFTKQQKYTLKEAVAAGAVPLGNPVRMVLRRIQEGAKFVGANEAMWNFRQSGIAVFKSPRAKTPDDYVKVQDKIAQVWRPVETAEGGIAFIPGGEWVMQKDAARLLNNYLSTDHIRGSAIGRGFVALKTSSTAMKMGLSLFHYGVITFWQVDGGLHSGLDELWNQGVRDLSGEKAVHGVKQLATAIFSPVTSVRGGSKIMNYLKDPDSFLSTKAGEKLARDYPDLPELLRLVFAGGFRPGFNEDLPGKFDTSIGSDLKVGKLVSGTMKAIPWLARSVAIPLFQYITPRTKLMFNVQMLAQKLDQYSGAIADGTITPETIARNVVALNDNRFGEINYQNNFWNNTVKTAMQLLFLAPGWKEGTWRGAAQAVRETFTQAHDDGFYDSLEHASGAGAAGNGGGGTGGRGTAGNNAEPGGGRRGDWARQYTHKLPQLGLNAGSLVTAAILATAIATLIDKERTGKWIWEQIEEDRKKNGLNWLQAGTLEALHPRTGKVNPQTGAPVRFNLPSDLRDYEHAVVAPAAYVYSSLAPWLTGIINTLRNRDSLGNYVYNPGAYLATRFKQGIAYNLSQSFDPITASNYTSKFGPQDTETRVEKTFGVIGGAPPEWDMTRATARAEELRGPRTPMTPEQQQAAAYAKEAPPTRHAVLKAMREKNVTELQRMAKMSPVVGGLSYPQLKDIYDHYANPDERKMLQPIMRQKQIAAVMASRR
jgi:hypothetical protein